ncbi:hypothetical protein LTR93_005736 [Exophiala xenobiotica]|nr:hypothetical protein LTR93_005736 [Exophiala xenobiotica]
MHTSKEHATVLSRMRATCTITIVGAITRSQTQRARTKNEDQSPEAPAPKKVKHMIQPFRPKKTHKLNAVSPAATVNAYLKALKEAYPNIRVALKEVCSKNAKQNKWEELGEKKEDFGMTSSVVKEANGRGFICLVATPDTGVYEKSHATKNAPSDWSPERREQYVEAQASTHVRPHGPTLIGTLDFLEYALEALGGDQIVTMPTMAVLFTKDGLKTRTRTIKKKSDTHSLLLRYKWLEREPPYLWVKYLCQQLKDNRFGIDVVTTGGGGNTTSGRSYQRPEDWVNGLILSKYIPNTLSKEGVLAFTYQSINERFSALISKAYDD